MTEHELDIRDPWMKRFAAFADSLSAEKKQELLDLFKGDMHVDLATKDHEKRKACIESGKHMTVMKERSVAGGIKLFCEGCGYAR